MASENNLPSTGHSIGSNYIEPEYLIAMQATASIIERWLENTKAESEVDVQSVKRYVLANGKEAAKGPKELK